MSLWTSEGGSIKLYGVTSVVRYYQFQRLARRDHVVVVVVVKSSLSPLAKQEVGVA